MSRSPPKSTLTKTLFPYTTLFRSRYKTVSDIGGALALLSRIVGARHQHLTFSSFDLPPVAPLAQKQIAAAGMEKRIKAVAGDFFKDELPKADRSEEHTSELQSLTRNSYAVFCLKKKRQKK